ncbi:Tautomerase/MIF [Vararia minispora EC-137]|uniref:Tautomerase/MIF n=1 Tax=Vararia minispora EC-137 TaxID=1314806 RepID=A0ACB8QNJ6_9AGAM|nr:Tautomerase/MIF [Vararia minispora EC-137]
MPALSIIANREPADLRSFVLEFSKASFAAETLGKPEKYIAVTFEYDENLSFAGSFDPAFFLNITSLGNITPENNIGYSKAFFDFFNRTLGAQDDRGYIRFADPGLENLGYKSTTFADLWKQK